MKKTTIVIADDHRMVRDGVRALLEAEPDFEVVAESGDGLETVRLVEHQKPNVLVLDLMMPGLNGLDVARQVKQRSPQTRIVVVSMHANEAYVLEALKNGASAYVTKDASAVELVRSVREALAGRRYLSPPLSEPAMDGYIQRSRAPNSLDLYDNLTNREREVFQLAAEGYTNSEIAGRLYISPRTVETHRANVMHKLGLRSQTELVRYALHRGIVSIEASVKRHAV